MIKATVKHHEVSISLEGGIVVVMMDALDLMGAIYNVYRHEHGTRAADAFLNVFADNVRKAKDADAPIVPATIFNGKLDDFLEEGGQAK